MAESYPAGLQIASAPQAEEAGDAGGILTVTGVLKLPVFTHTQTFPRTTQLHVAATALRSPIANRYYELLGVRPDIGTVSFLKPNTIYKGQQPTIGELVPDDESSDSLTINLGVVDPGTSPIETMAKEKRKALEDLSKANLENLASQEAFEKLKKAQSSAPSAFERPKSKKKKKKDATAAVGGNQSANDSMNITDLFAKFEERMVEKERTHTAEIERLSAKHTAEIERLSAKYTADIERSSAKHTAEIERSSRNHAAEIEKLIGRIDEMETEIGVLKSDNKRLTNIVHSLHRRTVLDEARNMLIDMCQVDRFAFVKPNDLLDAVQQKLLVMNKPTGLGDPELRMIFLPSAIRFAGNSAAHDASLEDLSLAILSSEPPDRRVLEQIFLFVTKQNGRSV